MRTLISLILLLFAILMFLGGAFEIEGIMGMPNLFWAFALPLVAQIALLISGSISSPEDAKIGFFRAVAALFYIMGALALPRTLIILLVGKFRDGAAISLSQLTWSVVISLTSVALLFYSAKTWHLLGNVPKGSGGGTT